MRICKLFDRPITFAVLTVACATLLGTSAQAATIGLTATVRDFSDTHPNFESLVAVDPGIVTSTLGADGKPVYAGSAGNPTTTNAADFDQWYRDTPGVNATTTKTLVLDNTITADPAIFTFSDSDFFPIDGELFGNEGALPQLPLYVGIAYFFYLHRRRSVHIHRR